MRAITVGRVGQRLIRFAYGNGQRGSCYLWGVKEYELRPRKKDGVYTWRLVDSWSTRSGHRPSAVLIKEGEDYAEARGLPFVEDIVHGTVVPLSPVEILALETT